MSSPVYNPPNYAPPVRASQTWFGRNWKWFVPCLVVTFAAVVTLFVFSLLSLAFGMMRSSEAYQTAITRAQQNPAVWAKIGHPFRVGKLLSGSIHLNGDSGDAEMSIPISGDQGSGHILVGAKKRAGKWTYQTLEVRVDSDGTVIPLLGPGGASSDDAV
jgi:hypothetical protein